MTSQAPRMRRVRTATESLLSIVLGLEAALLFFVTVTAFGLRVLAPAVAFGGGAALFILFLVAAWLVRYPAGVWLGWLLQAVLIATGVILVLMYFIGAGFAALWVYCFITARRLDRKNFPTTDKTAREAP
ncbi:putative membrane protein [Cryobacterium mesophilum]|uniref:DUF4233 domain-containing protein n=1 Tax=Terrimesophilobacter mesophilus TaxID=433647 RepID=A0A4V3I9E7_9MICO|nr:DUF4233 domain-containing protein [Terrimesophilobacter mesophilus]MBB5632316.1 putative membrane protein [Terrimesophilobacter mesophilus]TFB79158.1 DUF4233 domain-containing protein [Terrimesophilobacter mesophilus]